MAKLLEELTRTIVGSAELIEKAKVLDNLYIPSRNPNSHPEGAPFEHYGSVQSNEAIRYASEIVEFVASQVA